MQKSSRHWLLVHDTLIKSKHWLLFRWRDVCVVQFVVGITYSVAPAAQEVIRQGVLWPKLYGFIQMILGGQTEKEDREMIFPRCVMKQLLFLLPSVLNWSVLLHQPTSISQTPLTRNLVERPHTPSSHTPSLVFFPPLSPTLVFFPYLPRAALYLALFYLLRALRLQTEYKMLHVVFPHFILCN